MPLRQEVQQQSDVEQLAGVWMQSDAESAAGHRKTIEEIGQIKSVTEYASRKVEYVVESLVPAGTIILLTGESGDGKSTLATAMCDAIQTGSPFAGLKTERRPVLLLDRDNPLPVILERLNRLGIRDGENFRIWGGWCEDEPPEPYSPIIARWICSCEPKPVLMIDSVVAFHPGDENDASETRVFMQGLRRLTDLGATVLGLHNSGKAESSKDYRGSSDFKAGADIAYKITNCGDSSRLSTLRMKAFKSRLIVEGETIFRYVDDRFEIDRRPISRTNEEILRDVLVASPGSSCSELEDLAADKGMRRNRVRDVLDRWERTPGLIRIEQNSRRRKSHWWTGPEDWRPGRL